MKLIDLPVFLTADFTSVVNPITSFIESLTTPLLAIVGALGVIYCIFLGVKFAKAEEPQDREKAKTSLKNSIIGFGLIFILILVLKLAMPIMTTWLSSNTSGK